MQEPNQVRKTSGNAFFLYSSFSRSIRGSWYWGLTGTPAKASTFAVTNMCKWLNCDSLDLNAEDLINKVIKRNVPNLELPELSLEEIFITLSDSERALLSSLSSETNDDIETMLKLCSHHQISDRVRNDGYMLFITVFSHNGFL